MDRSGIFYHDIPSAATPLNQYKMLTNQDFYVAYYYPVKVKINKEILANHSPSIDIQGILNDTVQYATFLADDLIKPGDWILMWCARNNGLPDRRYRPYWINVGEVIEYAVDDEPYTKLVVEYSGEIKHNPPFEINSPDIAETIYSTRYQAKHSAHYGLVLIMIGL